MKINQFTWGRNTKRSSLAVLGIVAMLLSLLSNPGAGHAQTGASGTVVAWGSNSVGQTDVPAGLSDVTAISAGGFHNLALKNDGTVVAWGCGQAYNYGQCTVPAGLSAVAAVAAGQWHSLALKNDGTIVAWGLSDYGQTTVPAGLNNVTAIAGGLYHNLALKSDGTIVGWGYDNFGQASVPAGLSGVTAVDAGCFHSLALKSDGTVVAWGWNGAGQTTVPAGLSGVTAIAAGCDYNLALKSDGTVVGWGYNHDGQTTIPAGLSGVTAIAAGRLHSLALKNDGMVVAWGWNDGGQTNIPAGLNSVTVIAAGEMHSLALGQTDAAPAAQGQSVSTDEDTPLAVTLIATDAENSVLTYSIITTPAQGTLSGTVPNITYTPDANWNGTDHFTFKANDGLQDSNIATVTIMINPINDAPVAVAQSVATPKDTPLTLTLTATDVENSALTYTIVTGPAHGTLSGAAPDLTYTPNVGYAGDDFIYFSANDGERTSNVAMVNISVFIVSHHPSALDDAYSTYQNNVLTIAAPGVLSNDTDADGDPLYAHLVSGPVHGTLTLNVDGSFDYLPAANYAGEDSFNYQAVDGEQVSNIATVRITVSQTSNFAGFFEPVDNPGPGPRYIFNSVKAGSAVPVRFSLGGDQGLDIFSPGYPTSRPVKCATAARTDPIEQTVSAGNSSLNYDPASDTYTYVWKTENKWAGTCRVLTLQLDDGTQHLAYFRFK
jgi:hypothetical protein